MAYTAGVFYVDYELGSDAARTALTGCVISNPSGTVISVNKTAHGLVAGAVFDATAFSAWFNDAWKVLSVTDPDNFVVDGVWQTTADNNGTITPRGGSSMADAWKTGITGATALRTQPGDIKRVKASPPPVSLGVNGTWSNWLHLHTHSIASSTNATPIRVTISSATYTPANGDTINIGGHLVNTNANGTWKLTNVSGMQADLVGSVGNGTGGATGSMRWINNCVVDLASNPGGKNVFCPRDGETGNRNTKTNWTPNGGNVTCTVNTTNFKQGGECQQIAIAAGFTTGMAAYLPLASAQDYSGEEQLTFWINQTAGTLGAAGAIRLRLCSDTAGATVVDSFDVPALGALNSWFPVLVNKGSALGSSIQSVSLEVVTDNGAQTFLLDNGRTVLAAASAGAISLAHGIGKSLDDSFIAIGSIVGTRVMLDFTNASVPDHSISAAAFPKGYVGTAETVAAYVILPWLLPPGASSFDSPLVFPDNEAGTDGNLQKYSFGWDRTSMSTRNAMTWISGQNGRAFAIGTNGTRDFTACEGRVGAMRFARAIHLAGRGGYVEGLDATNNADFGITLLLSGNTLVDCRVHGSPTGLLLEGYKHRVDGVRVYGCDIPISVTGEEHFLIDAEQQAAHQSSRAGSGQTHVVVSRWVNFSSPNPPLSAAVSVPQGRAYFYNASISGTYPLGSHTNYLNGRCISDNHNGAAGDVRISTDGGLIASEATVRHTASGRAWSMAPTSAIRTANYPLDQEIARVAVAASALVTVKLWMRRTNTGLTMRLMCKGGQISGVASDAYTDMTAAADTWEEVTLTFTPSEAGVVAITAEAYGGTTYIGYVDDFSVSQA